MAKFARQGRKFAQNGAYALSVMFPGPNRDKEIARRLGVSDRMVRYLRKGRGWTEERLSIASEVLGEEFDRLLMASVPALGAAPRQIYSVDDEIAKLQAAVNELRKELERGNDVATHQNHARPRRAYVPRGDPFGGSLAGETYQTTINFQDE